MIKGPKKTVSVILPMDLYLEIQNLAHDTCRSVPSYIRQVLKHYLRYCAEHKDNPDDRWIV